MTAARGHEAGAREQPKDCPHVNVEVTEIVSSDYGDERHRCRDCGRVWIVEGPDA